MSSPKTIFCDLDGTLVKHTNPIDIQNPNLELKVLPGVHNKLVEWVKKGYYIIITTGRKESTRKSTEEQLQFAGIVYDQLIMGFGGGDRILINDRKPNSDRDTAYVINVDRNVGLEDEVI
jgi:hydroxymethylpyrimidine pyrophosphatase-like HAD family hydrolase|tara:strand:- start:3840 stop:4199 length:360 start_codon:yes stop_codon:yes gene_type:complete